MTTLEEIRRAIERCPAECAAVIEERDGESVVVVYGGSGDECPDTDDYKNYEVCYRDEWLIFDPVEAWLGDGAPEELFTLLPILNAAHAVMYPTEWTGDGNDQTG